MASEQTEKLREMERTESTVADGCTLSLIQHLRWLSQRVDELERPPTRELRERRASGEGSDDHSHAE